MAFSDKLFICFIVFIIKSVLVLSILTGGTGQTPKILLFDSSHPPQHINSYQNYTKNATYHLTKEQKKVFILSCMSDKPIRWRWMIDDTNMKSREMTKEREQWNASHASAMFSSNLTINLGAQNVPVATNFSCSNEIELVGYRLSQSTTCVELNYSSDEADSLRVYDGISIKQCLAGVQSPVNISTNCSHDLTVDVKKLEATCRKHRIYSVSCNNLDACDSHLSTYSKINYTCNRGNRTGGTQISTNKGDEGDKLLVKEQKHPLVVYCVKPLDSIYWTSFITLYPSARENSWTDFSYYTTLDAARNANSIQLYALSPGQKIHGIGDINNLSKRGMFAEGETVNFVCVAVKYLFMTGFQWKMNEKTLPYLPETNTSFVIDNSTQSLHIVQKEIVLSLKTHGRYFNISCMAPIWNSVSYANSTIDGFIYPPLSPHANVSCKVMAGRVNCSCQYGGWPQPTISWNTSVSLNMSILERLSPEMPVDSTPHPPLSIWHAYKTFVKPQLSPSKPLIVKCIAENFKGSIAASFEIKDDSVNVRNLYIMITAILVPVCVLAATIVIIMYWRYRKKLILYAERQYNLTIEEINEFYSGCSHTSTTYEALLLPYNSEYEIPKEELTFDGSILGSGQFGLVLQGKIGPLTVAVKTIKPTADLIYFKSLLSELKILQFVGQHPNIVNLIGANTTNIKNREVFLVLDFCSNGSLVNFLRQCRERFINFFAYSGSDENQWPLYQNSADIILTTNNLIGFALEIASALDHLASKNVIHGDLAARNVLVTEDLHAKICDFGLSKQLLHYTVYVQKIDCPLPLRWMALESLQDMEFSLASDKWSYGVVLWEIFSLGELPYPGEQWSFESYKMLQEGYRMAKPKYANDSVYRLMLECWNAQPQQRPSFPFVISQLRKEEEMLT